MLFWVYVPTTHMVKYQYGFQRINNIHSLINYSCSFAEVYRISNHPHVLYTVPKPHSADLCIFFSLILYFLLGSLSHYFVSECGRQNNCLYISWIDFLHSSNTVVRLALRHPWQPLYCRLCITAEKKHSRINTLLLFSTGCYQGQALAIKTERKLTRQEMWKKKVFFLTFLKSLLFISCLFFHMFFISSTP